MRRSGASFTGEFVLSQTAMAMAGDVEVMVPLEGLVDVASEVSKLEKDLAKLEGSRPHEAEAVRSELHQPRPGRGAGKDRARLAEAEANIAKVQVALARSKTG